MSFEFRVVKKKTKVINPALVMFAVILAFCMFYGSAHAAGGDVIWEFGDTPQADKQEARTMVVDSAGNTIITGISDQSGSYDYHTVKIKADGSGVLWRKTYDNTGGEDYATAVSLDSDDNVIVTGYAWNGTNYDFHTIKYNAADGTVLWEHSFNADTDGDDYNTTVTVDGLNNVYIGGNSQQESGIDDIILIKYGPDGPNPDGSPLWQATYNGPAGGHDRITGINAGVDGIAITGLSQNSTPDFDAITLKYGFDGSLTWEKRKSVSGNDEGAAVNMDSSGNVIMTGVTYNGSDRDIYTVKYGSSDGAIVWEKTYDGGYDEEPADVFVDSGGDVYITGYTFLLTSANDFYTAKYDSDTGALQWSDTFNSANGNNDRAVSIVVDESGDVFVSGDAYDDAAGNYNFQTLKYTKSGGNLLWQKIYNGSAGKSDRVVGVDVTSSGGVIVAGYSDMWTSGASDFDYYTIKYDPGLLNPPTNLTAATVSTSQIDLSWTDNSTNEDGFKIERKIGDFGTYSQTATVGPDITAYSDTGLSSDTKYYYRVRSYNSASGDSYYSNEDYAVTTIVSFSSPASTYTYAGPDSGDDYAVAVAAGPDNTPVVTGYSYSSAGQFDYYTIKLNKDTLAPEWDARYDSDQNDMDRAVAVLADGNNDVLVSGTSYLFSVESGGNTNDIYSIKYPSAGPPEVWNDQYNGPAGDDDRSYLVDVSTDGSNNYVVVGYGRNADWNDDIYVVKYLSDGTMDWAASPYDGGVFGHDYPSAVAFDSSGDIIMSGKTYNGSDYDFITRKYSGVDGSVVWTDVYDIAGAGDDFTRSLAVDQSGNVYVTGVAVTASGNEDFYTIKYNGSDGTRLWEKSYNGPADGVDEAMAVKVDPVSGDIVVAGSALVAAGNNEFHTLRYDSAGNVVWERTIDRPDTNDFVAAMAMDFSGNVHITGDSDNGSDTDVIAIRYDHEGSFVSGTEYSGSAGNDDGVNAVAVNDIGEAFAAGYTMNADGNADYLVFKISGDKLVVPTPFTAAYPDYTQVDLSWTDNARNEDGYKLERKIGGCASSNTWSLIYDAPSGETAYSDTGLNIGADYCYRIRTYSNSGKSSRWVEKAVTTLSPQAPGDLLLIGGNTTEADLSWTDNTINETGFTIQRCEGAGCDFSSPVEFNVTTDVDTYLDNTVCESTAYSYRVKSYKTGEWVTDYSNVIDVTTDPIAGPTDLAASRISEVQVDLSWTDNSGDETGFRIERCAGAGCSDFAEIDTVGADVTAYSNTGITPSTSYTYRVRAYKTAVCSWETGYSNTSSASTTITDPSGLSASTVNSTQIDLVWTEETASESGFKIERCEGAGCGTFAEIDTVGPDVTAYSDTSACENTTYNYRVKAYRELEWESGYTNEASAATAAKVAPAVLTATAFSESRIDLAWQDNTDDETGFQVERCTGSGCSDFGLLATTPGTTDETAYLKFDENYGSTAADATGNGNDGTVNGAVWTTGKYGSALNFSGNSDYVDVGSVDLGSAWSIEAWFVYPLPATSSWNTLTRASSESHHQIIVKRSVMELGTYTGGFTSSGYVITGLSDGWHHIAAVGSSGSTVFYIDGQPVGTSTAQSTSDIRSIGNHWAGEQQFGTVDDVVIYSRALSDSEVLDHYQNGKVVKKMFSDEFGLVPGTTYSYRVRAYKDAACSWQTGYTNTVEEATLLPPAPTDLAASVINTTQVDLSWIDNTDTETGFRVQRCIGVGCDFSTYDEFTVGADVTTYSDTSVCEDTSYRYRVRGEKDDGPVWQTTWTTPTNDVTTPAVSAPTGLTATTITESQIDLLWPDNFVDETGYKIERCAGVGCSDFSLIATASGTYEYDVLSYWKLDEGSGPASNDSAGGYNGTINGAVWTTGKYNTALSFDGDDDFVNYGDINEMDAPGYFSISLWFYRTADQGSDTNHNINNVLVAQSSNSNNDNLEIGTQGTNVEIYLDSSGGTDGGVSYNAGIQNDTWYHLAVTYDKDDGNELKLYIDGNFVAEWSNYGGNLDNSSGSPFAVGIARPSGSNWGDFKGVIDEPMIISEVLDADEVSAIYNEGLKLKYEDTGLQVGQVYRYRIYAYKDATCAWNTDYSTIEEDETTPPVPTDLTAASVNTTQIDLSWNESNEGETGFSIERCTGVGCSDFSEIATVGNNVTVYSDTTVCENTSYKYRVKAYRTAEWESGYSSSSSGTTPVSTAPSGFAASRISETQINVAWTDNTSDETGFEIERCTGAACSDFVLIATPGADVSSYSDTGLVYNTTYNYRVRAYKSADCGWNTGYSNSSSATTTISDPSGLTATTVNTTRIDLSWTDNTASETKYIIERCTGSGCGDFAEIEVLDADAVGYSDTSVCNSTTYNYRVKAEKSGTLSNDGGGCWTRKAPLSITDFAADYSQQITIAYDSDMQPDFDDIRFYDETSGKELPYWIESKTDGVEATVWFRTGQFSTVSLYYGNASAASSSDPGEMFIYDPSDPGSEFSKYASNPVLNPGSGGQWDDAHVLPGSVIKEGGVYRMWYAGHDGSTFRIGYATSSDGMNWTKHASNPVLNIGSGGAWDELQVYFPAVIYDGGTYRMWYAGHDGSIRIGYATSDDGINWTKYESNPVINLGSGGQWDDAHVLPGSVIKEGGVYRMWYAGHDGSTTWRIGYATSSDGISWTRDESNPVLDIGLNGQWDDERVLSNTVLKDNDGIYKMWYAGRDGSSWRIGYATSSDGISWNKDESNPVLDLGPGGAWDDDDVKLPAMINDSDGMYKMWYSGNNGSNWRTGYASVRPVATVTPEPSVAFDPEEQSACYSFNGWSTGYSDEAEAATLTISAPGGFLTTAITDTEADLEWTDNSMDETGFKIERCAGEGCSDYAEIASVDSDITSYADSGLLPETVYCYRARAYKTAECGWDTVSSNESCDLTYSAHPTTLTATALNSLVIRLDWIDNANDEDGYELEVQIFNGKFVKIATLGPDVTTFTDAISIEPEKEYIYRVRAFRAADKSPYSNEASVTTPAYVEGDDTCVE